MQRVLRISLAATLAYVVITLIAGLRAHSLALMSEAGHNASDALALLLSFVAVHFQTLPATDQKTFGYQRAGVLAAFLNALTLIVISGWIAFEAVHRFIQPEHPKPAIMTSICAACFSTCWATRFRPPRSSLAARPFCSPAACGSWLTRHSMAAIAPFITTPAAATIINPALSLAIAAMILWSSIAIVRESLNILLEGTPRGLSLKDIRARLEQIEGVQDVHDLHVWSLGSQTHALASHVTIADIPLSESTRILDEINGVLLRNFHIHHTTIQFEHAECPVAHGCVMPVEAVGAHEHHH